MPEKAEQITIRCATPDDAEALRRIYAPYVLETAVTFECEVPTVGEFAARIAKTLERYPYLVAECDGIVRGYAYAGPFKQRTAYDWSTELSVYVERDVRGRGIGRSLYTELENQLGAMGLINLYASIATAGRDDEYVTFDSIYFHERMGFSFIGRF